MNTAYRLVQSITIGSIMSLLGVSFSLVGLAIQNPDNFEKFTANEFWALVGICSLLVGSILYLLFFRQSEGSRQ